MRDVGGRIFRATAFIRLLLDVRPCAKMIMSVISFNTGDNSMRWVLLPSLSFINRLGLGPHLIEGSGWIAGPFSELGALVGRFARHSGIMKVITEGEWTSGGGSNV